MHSLYKDKQYYVWYKLKFILKRNNTCNPRDEKPVRVTEIYIHKYMRGINMIPEIIIPILASTYKDI